VKDLHALIAAQVYARLVLSSPTPWEQRSPMEQAIQAADDFVREYRGLETSEGFDVDLTHENAEEPAPEPNFGRPSIRGEIVKRGRGRPRKNPL
jgi:hypothetical protein